MPGMTSDIMFGHRLGGKERAPYFEMHDCEKDNTHCSFTCMSHYPPDGSRESALDLVSKRRSCVAVFSYSSLFLTLGTYLVTHVL